MATAPTRHPESSVDQPLLDLVTDPQQRRLLLAYDPKSSTEALKQELACIVEEILADEAS